MLDDLGTYDATVQVLAAGAPGNAAVLYDSHNRLSAIATFVANVPDPFPQVARAEGGRARIVRVQGWLAATPTVWALGSRYLLGIRFGMFEQDPSTGAFLIDPTYSMWSIPGNVQLSPAVWANDRQWQHERRIDVSFNDNNQTLNWRFNFAVNRSLQPNWCYGIYLESQAGSVALNTRFFFRTLVSDEG